MHHRSGERRQPSWRGRLPLALRRRVSGLALMGRNWRDCLVFLLLLITVLMGPNGLLTSLPAWAAQGSPFGKSGPPNLANPGQYATSKLHLPPAGTSDPNWRTHAPVPIEHTAPMTMQPGTLHLHAGTSAQFLGSDDRLEVDVPTTAVTSSDESQAGGTLSLQITQIAPASGSSAGGSGLISFGTYLLQLVDAHGKRVPYGLRAPITLKYHYSAAEGALNLERAFVVFNGPLPRAVKLAPAAVSNIPDQGARATVNAMLDATQRTLTVTPLVGPSGSISWNTDSPVSTFGKPDIFNADQSAGSLSASYPIDVPAGPGGLTPPINLAYSSAGVSENHGAQSAAGWVGEGWTLAPGSISWAEHNVTAGCGTCGANWQNSWQFSDPFGTSAELIPPNLSTSTYYDDLGTAPGGTYESYQGQVWSSSSFSWSNAKWVTGDFNGDGKTDIVAAYDLGNGAIAFYEWQSTGGGFTSLGQVWSSSSFSWSNAAFLAGDFNGDGKTDIVAAYDLGNGTFGFYEWQSTGSGFTSLGRVWTSGSFSWASTKFVAGDFNGDGKADIMGMYDLGNNTFAAYEWQSTGSGFNSLGAVWTSGSFTWANTKFVAGDFNGDGKADIAGIYDLGNNTFAIYEWLGTSSGITLLGSGPVWTSGSFTWANTKWVAGDVNGDGKADLLAMYDLGSQGDVPAVGTYEWLGTTSGVSYQGQVWSSVGRGGWSWASAQFLAGDYNADGKADVLATYDLGNGATGFYQWLTTSTSLTNPISWQTAPDSHARIYSYWGPNQLSGAPIGPVCFRVFLTNGVMEEFGCTSDSVQYYYQQSGANAGKPYLANWLLDLVTDPKGNQIHYTYQADMATDSGGHSYPRDVVLSTVEWDSPSCHDAQQRCTNSNWAPLLRVSFQATHIPARFSPGSGPSGTCNSGSNLRCDDPVDLSGSSGLAAPQVESTFVLNDILVQVNNGGTWKMLKDYQLSYEQSGPGAITDPQTSKQESTAGMLDLTQINVVGDDLTTTEPTRAFGYSTQTEHYEDDAYPAPAGNCGPSWNTGCLMWSQSYAGNSRYLASVTNGMGLYQTFSWAEARNNTHGVYLGGSNNANPLYCDASQLLAQPHCNQADDQAWSHIVLTLEQEQVVQVSQNGQGGQQTNNTITSQTAYTYYLTTPLAAQACSDCVAGMYWGNQNDADYLDYYNGKFMGFAQTIVSNPDGSMTVHKYYATNGWGIYDAPNTAPNYLGCFAGSNPCHADPWWNPNNALHGHEYETDQYDTNGTTLLHQTKTLYSVTCPPSGVSGTGSTSYGNFDGNLVSELDHNNPVAACDIQTSLVDDYTYDGSNASGVPDKTTTYQYDSYGRVTQTTTTSNDGGATGSPTTIITKSAYIWNDAVSANPSSVLGTYLINFVAFTDTEDASGNRYSCTATSYDGQSYASGQQSALTSGKVTTTTKYTNCGTKANNFTDASGPITTSSTYDQWGNAQTTLDADANAGISGHTASNCLSLFGAVSSCTQYDSTFETLTVATSNALGQQEQTGYTQTAAGGFGLWPTSTTDVNGQTTTYGYDGLGRMTSRTLPGETSGQPTTTWAYTFWCGQSGPQTPCMEVDEIQRLNAAYTITTRAFYDGLGRLVELRSPGPNGGANGQDVVHYRYYDPSGRVWFESVQYFVPAYSGPAGSYAFSVPDSTQAGTTTTFDGLGRVTSTKDAVSDLTTNGYSVVCGTISGDSACYEQGLVTDPLNHQRATLGDALGRESYDVRYTGNSSSTYHVYATTKFTYDYLTNLTKILAPDGVTTTTFQFDMLGRQTGLVDPDRGTESYVYDLNGNRTQSVDARGSSGTVYVGYDGLNRQIWRSTSSTGSNPYVTYTYDSTANGNDGVGHVTNETFTNGSLSGSYSYVYDQRGQQTKNTLTVGSASYPVQTSYDDATNVLSQTYPDGEVVTNSYTTQGWLTGVNTQVGSTNVSLLSNASYTGVGGAGHLISGATLDGGMYQYATTYDALLRLTDTTYTRSGGATLYDEQRAFDAAGNVTYETTTLPQGTDAQVFCYDEQDRVTWAGSVGTPPCGTAISPGTLTSAQYSQSYSYDTLGRLTSGALGSYTYGASAHVHAVTSIGGSYTASYDAAGDMTCRAPTSATTCTGSTPTGAELSYDNEGRLAQWQNTPTSPTTTDNFLYDAEGNRVAQQATQNGTTTTTVYVGNLEEVATTGSSTTTTTYYYAGGQRIALAVNGLFSYLATDAETSISVAFDANGNVQASQLFSPYGAVRYGSGTMPGSYGFTGQHADPVTGLDYYNARYYDPAAEQFTSADTILPGKGLDPWGLSRYAYVEGNPISRTDPTGHGWFDSIVKAVTHVVKAVAPVVSTVLDATTGIPSMINDVKTVFSGNTSTLQKIFAVGDLVMNVAMDASMVVGVGEGLRAAYVGVKVAEDVGVHALEDAGEHAVEDTAEHAVEDTAEHGAEDGGEHAAEDGSQCGLSFSADTLVATPSGERAIGTLHVGDAVLAYDPQTHQVSVQTVLHVWINHDTDLLDVTLHTEDGTTQQTNQTKPGTSTGPASTTGTQPNQSSPGTSPEEMVHTTAKHPWLTADLGWVTAGQLKIGEPVIRADGKRAIVVAIRVNPGAGRMYDLEVSHVHTFEVGLGRWVVHNCTLKDGTQVDVENGLKQTFDKHAKQWFGRNVTDADRPAWENLVRDTLNSSKIFPWSTRGTPTIAVLRRLVSGGELRYFVVQFYTDSRDLATAFRPNPSEVGAMLGRLGIK